MSDHSRREWGRGQSVFSSVFYGIQDNNLTLVRALRAILELPHELVGKVASSYYFLVHWSDSFSGQPWDCLSLHPCLGKTLYYTIASTDVQLIAL